MSKFQKPTTITNKQNQRKRFIGLMIVSIGILFFIQSLNLFFIPRWLLSWHVILIIAGLYLGAKSEFKNVLSIILLLIGGLGLFSEFGNIHTSKIIPAIVLVCLGIYLVLGKTKAKRLFRHQSGFSDQESAAYDTDIDWDKRIGHDPEKTHDRDADKKKTATFYSTEDILDSTSIFGHVKKNIDSKNFKGGEIINIMGGTDINLLHADIKSPIVLDITQLFGGCNILVPAHWRIVPDMANVFGSLEDKRIIHSNYTEQSKTVYIQGITLFGGVTIKNL